MANVVSISDGGEVQVERLNKTTSSKTDLIYGNATVPAFAHEVTPRGDFGVLQVKAARVMRRMRMRIRSRRSRRVVIRRRMAIERFFGLASATHHCSMSNADFFEPIFSPHVFLFLAYHLRISPPYRVQHLRQASSHTLLIPTPKQYPRH